MTIRLSPGWPVLFITVGKLFDDIGEAGAVIGISESVGGLLHIIFEELGQNIFEISCCIEGFLLRASRYCGIVPVGQIMVNSWQWQCDS